MTGFRNSSGKPVIAVDSLDRQALALLFPIFI
jgi:hypothetical protein